MLLPIHPPQSPWCSSCNWNHPPFATTASFFRHSLCRYSCSQAPSLLFLISFLCFVWCSPSQKRYLLWGIASSCLRSTGTNRPLERLPRFSCPKSQLREQWFEFFLNLAIWVDEESQGENRYIWLLAQLSVPPGSSDLGHTPLLPHHDRSFPCPRLPDWESLFPRELDCYWKGRRVLKPTELHKLVNQFEYSSSWHAGGLDSFLQGYIQVPH